MPPRSSAPLAGASPLGGALMTVAEVASALRVSKMTIYRLIRNGELAALRVGRSFRVPEPEFRAYLDTAA